jgi:hypothetical protein
MQRILNTGNRYVDPSALTFAYLQSYKWGNVAIGALAVLGVAMASSMMSAAIRDIRKDFPGYSSEMYIMSESPSRHNNNLLISSYIRFRPWLCGRSFDLGTMLRSIWSTNHVLYDVYRFHGV